MNRLMAKFAGSPPTPTGATTDNPLDYDKLVHLDAESLAENGILPAYLVLLPRLKQFAPAPIEVTEEIDNDELSYSVRAGGLIFQILEVGGQTTDCWERATVAFFEIVNANLSASSHRFYALYGGNDLSGMFLTSDEVAAARLALKKKSDWPWLPVNMPPHYGHPADM